jgi:rhomboid protease GluP
MTFSLIYGLVQYGYSDSAGVVDEKSVLLLAQEYIQSEEYNKAFQLLDRFEEKEQSQSPDILFLLSYTEIKRENLEQAAEHLERVLGMNPDFHEAHYNLALVYLEQENFRQALIHAENALEIQPGKSDYQSLHNKISSYLQSAESE